MAKWKCRKHKNEKLTAFSEDEVPECPSCQNRKFVYDADAAPATKVDVGLTCSATGPVRNWADSHNDTSLDEQMGRIRTSGLGAGGLRNVGTNIYDFHSGASSDYRYYGRATTTTFQFIAVYKHSRGGGKTFVTGENIGS